MWMGRPPTTRVAGSSEEGAVDGEEVGDMVDGSEDGGAAVVCG